MESISICRNKARGVVSEIFWCSVQGGIGYFWCVKGALGTNEEMS